MILYILQVRIYRIQRDIPMPLVTSGVEKGNLRELALARMGQLGTKCRDVRTREAGIQDIHHQARTCPLNRASKNLLCASGTTDPIPNSVSIAARIQKF